MYDNPSDIDVFFSFSLSAMLAPKALNLHYFLFFDIVWYRFNGPLYDGRKYGIDTYLF